jgi:hypothetical protein
MSAIAVVIGLVGAAFPVFAFVRIMSLQRRGAPREQVLGYMALMIAAAAAVFFLLRIL